MYATSTSCTENVTSGFSVIIQMWPMCVFTIVPSDNVTNIQ